MRWRKHKIVWPNVTRIVRERQVCEGDPVLQVHFHEVMNALEAAKVFDDASEALLNDILGVRAKVNGKVWQVCLAIVKPPQVPCKALARTGPREDHLLSFPRFSTWRMAPQTRRSSCC